MDGGGNSKRGKHCESKNYREQKFLENLSLACILRLSYLAIVALSFHKQNTTIWQMALNVIITFFVRFFRFQENVKATLCTASAYKQRIGKIPSSEAMPLSRIHFCAQHTQTLIPMHHKKLILYFSCMWMFLGDAFAKHFHLRLLLLHWVLASQNKYRYYYMVFKRIERGWYINISGLSVFFCCYLR